MQSITGVARSYDWGSATEIQRFLGRDLDEEPIAEMWFGAHPDGPSPIAGSDKNLLDLLSDDPALHLGDAAAGFGRLPYLLKLLAPARSVSLQVHPSSGRARAGFDEDERAGIPRSSSQRRYKDPFHKPEMVFALTRFTGLVGFRPLEEVGGDLTALRSPLAVRLSEALESSGAVGDRRRRVLSAALSADEPDVGRFTDDAADVGAVRPELQWLSELARQYPGDAGVAAAMLLRRVTLMPGEAVFVPSGMIHAYASGLAVEVMANSDTVLRAGLTSKLVDVPALLAATDFRGESGLEAPIGTSGSLFTPDADEFALWHASPRGEMLRCPLGGPRIAVALSGRARLTTERDATHLTQGKAVFVSAEEGRLTTAGVGSVVVVGPRPLSSPTTDRFDTGRFERAPGRD